MIALDESLFARLRPLPTPFVLFDLDRVQHNYTRIRAAFPNLSIYYAMKCNSSPRVVAALAALGSGVEIASQAEARQLFDDGLTPDRIICMHPIKSPGFLAEMEASGLTVMAVDSYEEVDKIARYAPHARLVVRVSVDNEGSRWHLNGKFGMDITEFPQIFTYIRSKGLIPYGLTFHVGSQCENPANWIQALRICKGIWETAAGVGIHLAFLSLGGGLPVHYNRPVPSIEELGARITRELRANFETYRYPIEFAIEPGRAIVADAGVLVTSVFGTARRGTTNWAYIETGTYNGLVESIETKDRNLYPITVEATGRPLLSYHIGGPTCVTLDTPFEEVELPELAVGDRLYIRNAGAYTVPCGAPFNGFPVPEFRFYQDLEVRTEAEEPPDERSGGSPIADANDAVTAIMQSVAPGKSNQPISS